VDRRNLLIAALGLGAASLTASAQTPTPSQLLGAGGDAYFTDWLDGFYTRALADGVAHRYRFFTEGTSGNKVVEPPHADPNDVVVNATFAPPASLAVTSFGVQHGLTERSFVRYVDLGFNQTGPTLQSLIDGGKIRLIQHPLTGPTAADPAVPLGSYLHALDHAIELDFGPGGLGNAASSTSADGYYEVQLDLDGAAHADGTPIFGRSEFFYRLLGDVTGDHVVDNLDLAQISAALGTANPESDVNGQGVVNAYSRTLATRAKGHRLAGSPHLDA